MSGTTRLPDRRTPAGAVGPVPADVGAELERAGLTPNAATIARVVGNALPGAAAAAFTRAPTPPLGHAVLARDGATGGGGVAVSSTGVKISLEGSTPEAKKSFSYVEIAGKVTFSGEVVIKEKGTDDPTNSGKGGGGKGQKSGGIEKEIPLWKAAAKGEVEEAAKQEWTDYFEPTEAALVFGGEGGSKAGEGSSMSASVGIKCKTKSGDEWTTKVQLLEYKKTGAEGPAIKAEYAKKALEFKEFDLATIGGKQCTMSGKVDVKPEVAVKPNYAAIAARVGAQSLIRVGAAAAPVAIPLAAAAVMAYGAYVAERNRGAALAGSQAGVRGRDQLKKATKSYASVLLSGSPNGGGDIGSQYASTDLKSIVKAAGDDTLTAEEIGAKIRETKGSESKVAKENTDRLRQGIYDKLCAEFDKDYDPSFWEMDETWGGRGVFRQHCKMVLFHDDGS